MSRSSLDLGSPQGGRRGSRTAYIATSLAALLAALVLALTSAPACAQPASARSSSHALVAQDRTALRAAPREAGAVHTELTQGDLLEVRGQRLDHLQVYDHRRERGGYVRVDAVRRIQLAAHQAEELLVVLRFLRHAPGQEALGIAYVAAYLQAAPAERISAEPFDALGTMAERLARRASMARAGDRSAAQVDAMAAYGVRFVTVEREGRLQLCYDGEAFRRVLALKPEAAEQARAMLALTRHDCVDPLLAPTARIVLDVWRADLLDTPWPRGYNELGGLMKNRLHLRRAGVWAARAHQLTRSQRPALAATERALAELATVDKSEFTDDDQLEHAEAAIRVGAVRWAAVPARAAAAMGANGLRFVTHAGAEPGQTCVALLAAEEPPRAGGGGAGGAGGAGGMGPAGGAAPTAPGRTAHGIIRTGITNSGPHLLAERCTFGTVWTSSLSLRPGGDALALAVQPLEGWTELWLFRAERGAWRIDVLPPAATAPGLGHVEFAGWVPGAQPRLLVARESRTEGRFDRRFEVLALDTLEPVKQASTPSLLAAFAQWSDAQWRRPTVALR